MAVYLKDPAGRLEYAIDWAATGGAIVASDWSVAPAETGGVAIAEPAVTATRTQAVLAGGMAGKVYRVTNRVTFVDGRIDERSLALRVEER